MKKSLFKKHRPSQEVSLQITSMADIFTILLVFLLKSFSSDTSKISPHNTLTLPEVKTAQAITDTLKLEVSDKLILVDDKPVTELSQFLFDPTDLETDGTSRALNTVLIQQRLKNQSQQNPRLMILADRNTPFSTLRRVLASASNNGFEDFKLVVVEEQ